MHKSPGKDVAAAFNRTCSGRWTIVKIEGVQNQMLYDKWRSSKQIMMSES